MSYKGTTELGASPDHGVVIVECAVSMNAHKIVTRELESLSSKLKSKDIALNRAAATLAQAGVDVDYRMLDEAIREYEKASQMIQDLVDSLPADA